jgi:hypothetical protein
MDKDILPVNLQAIQSEPTSDKPSFKPIGKIWKIIIGFLLFINIILFLHTAYLYYFFRNQISLLAFAIQSDPLSLLVSIVGIIVEIVVFIIYLHFRKRRFQERADIPTSTSWKLFFAGLTFLYFFLGGFLVLYFGGILLGLSVVTDTIIATFNVIILLIYFDRHKPRKLFQVLGNIIIYLSLTFIAVGIVLQTLSVLSYFLPENP